MKILVVEDHADSANALARLLRIDGHTVQTAGGVAAATQLAAEEPFDLLLCDLGLPDGSGLDLMRDLKSRYGMKGVAVTGSGMDKDIASCREAGFDSHVTKPCSPEKLNSVLERLDHTRTEPP